MDYKPTDFPGYVKDGTRGHLSAVLNTDVNGLNEYKLQRARLLKVNQLESEVAELKQMVKLLLGNKNV